MAEHPEVVVIGGGITGLAVAATLRERGCSVTLVDEHGCAGDGDEPLQTSPSFEQLLWRLGRVVPLARAEPSLASLHVVSPHGEVVVKVEGSGVGVSGAMSFLRRVSLRWGLSTGGIPNQGASIADAASNPLGATVDERLVRPLCEAQFGAEPHELSSAMYLGLPRNIPVRATEIARALVERCAVSQRVTVPGGSAGLRATLMQALGGRVAFRHDRVTAIFQGARSYPLTVQCESGERLSTAGVVVAVDSERAVPLLMPLEPATAQAVAAARFVREMQCTIEGAELPYRLRSAQGVWSGWMPNGAIRRLLFVSRVFRMSGSTIACTAMGRGELTEGAILNELRARFGITAQAVTGVRVVRKQIYPPGYEFAVQALRALEARIPGLLCVGRGSYCGDDRDRLEDAVLRAQALSTPSMGSKASASN